MPSSRDLAHGLSEKSIPGPDAGWSEIEEFAVSFDAPGYHGSYNKIVEIAGLKCHETLSDLRTCLYMEGRRWRQCRMIGIEPGEQDVAYMKELIVKIREQVAKEKGTLFYLKPGQAPAEPRATKGKLNETGKKREKVATLAVLSSGNKKHE